jgi:hypothetical protein
MSIPATDRISFLSPKLPEGCVIPTEPTIRYSVFQNKLTVLFSLNLQMVYSHWTRRGCGVAVMFVMWQWLMLEDCSHSDFRYCVICRDTGSDTASTLWITLCLEQITWTCLTTMKFRTGWQWEGHIPKNNREGPRVRILLTLLVRTYIHNTYTHTLAFHGSKNATQHENGMYRYYYHKSYFIAWLWLILYYLESMTS